MNVLDVDHSNSLDKTTAGDTLSGVVTMAPTAVLQAQVAGNVQGQAANAIKATVAGGIASGVTSGIALTGGSTDYPTFGVSGASPRTRTMVCPFDTAPWVSAALQSVGGFGTFNPGTATTGPLLTAAGGFITNQVSTGGSPNQYAYYVPLRQLHNGATLTTVTPYFIGHAGHGGLPASMPAVAVYRFTIATGAFATLNSVTAYAVDPTSVLATYQSLHSWPFTPNQNNVIDTSQYFYALVFWDEGGTNALPGGNYLGATLAYSAISDMRFA